MQKLGVCYGAIDTMGTCQDSAGTNCTVVGGVNPDFPNKVTSAWVRWSDGTVDVLEWPNADYTSPSA